MTNMKIIRLILCFFLLLVGITKVFAQSAHPNFDSIYKRPIPSWFNEAKVGIFVVWGPYSIPSYAPKGYAEWYWKRMQTEKAVKDFHERTYGKDFEYQQFANKFTAELWDPDFWCKIFKEAGAKYVVTTANFHDGFAMYPTKYSETIGTKKWNSMVVGPKRDIIGELDKAGKKYGLKMGIYYSLTEWYHPWWKNDRAKYVSEWFHPKFKDLVTRYKPWFIFLDGDWMPYKQWKSEELAAWLYTQSAVKDYVVTNDRWGKPARGRYGDVFESEYGSGKFTSPNHPWQEDRGIGTSYGYNRMENILDYDSRDELIRTLSNVVGGGGNFLLCVGPTVDGRIPVIMQERLLQMGKWLKVNGEAVYGSSASPFWPRTFDWGTVSRKPGKIFLHVHKPAIGEIHLDGLSTTIKDCYVLTTNGKVPVKYQQEQNAVTLSWNPCLNDKAVTIIELDISEGYKVDKTQRQFTDGSLSFNCRAMTLKGKKAYPYYNGNQNRLWMADWTDPKESLSIELIFNKAGKYNIQAIYAASAQRVNWEQKPTVEGTYSVEIAGYKITATIEESKTPETPEPKEIGTILIPNPGKYQLTVSPVDNGDWNGFRFQGIQLVPDAQK